MPFSVALAGKGGTGKTTLAGMLIKYLVAKEKTPILAVDADCNSNLNEVLGLGIANTLGNAREDMKKGSVPSGMTKDIFMSMKLEEAVIESDAFDLIVMGQPEGQGCYCPVNHVLREIIDTVAKNYDYVVIDAEAGLEHLSRRTTQDVDVMLVVTDPSKRGITTAHRIKELAEHLEIKFAGLYLIANRTTKESEEKMGDYAKEAGLEVIGTIPEDEKVREFDFEGRPLIEIEDSKALNAVEKILQKLVKQ